MTGERLDDLPLEVQGTLLTEIAVRAVVRFDLGDQAQVSLHRLGENAVFLVEAGPGGPRFALRVHRPDYRSDTEIGSELAWLEALQSAGRIAPAPVAGSDGEYVQIVDGGNAVGPRQCDLLTWIDGPPLRRVDPQLAIPALGTTMALLHQHARSWLPPPWFKRPVLDERGLLGSAAVIGDYRSIVLDSADRALFDRATELILDHLVELPKTPDCFGLIHSDFLDNNLLYSGESAAIVDFDDASLGWYAYDLGTVRCMGKALTDEPGWLELFRSGYAEVAVLPQDAVTLLPVFLAVRALAMVGWLAGHGVRAAKYRQMIIDDAVHRCASLLADSAA